MGLPEVVSLNKIERSKAKFQISNEKESTKFDGNTFKATLFRKVKEGEEDEA